MSRIYQDCNTLCFKGDGETLRIEAWGNNAFRVRSTYMHEIQDSDFSLLPRTETNQLHIELADTFGSIQNGELKAVLEKKGWGAPAEISFFNAKGKLLLKEKDRGGALAKKARHFKPNLGGDFALTMSFESPPEEKLYGMGQYQQDHFNLKNCSLELAHRNSQASVPFYLSSEGYGFLWHNPAVGEVHFSKNGTTWSAQSTKQLDYWICADSTPDKILHAYADATGKVPMMPEYGLGFWQCKLRYWNQEQLLEVAREYKRRKLPIDVIVCDFFHWPKMGDFRFEETYFPNPKAMVDELKEMDIKLMVSVWPQVDLESENYEEMKGENLLIRPERGMNISMGFGGFSNFFDATNPAARAYVWEKCKKNYYDDGIVLFWLDEAEPEFGIYDYDNYRCYAGPYNQIGNLYPQLFSRTFYDGMIDAGQKKVVNLVRCAWSGSQRYGALVWSGDIASTFSSMKNQLVAGLHMSIAGIPWWTTDIGGFYGGDPKDLDFQELLVRWFQWATFCPVMRLHGDRTPSERLSYPDGRSNLFTGSDNEVWSYGEDNYKILASYLHLRESMRPYTRKLMEEAHEIGSPIMRPMFYEFPDDDLCWDLNDQYMFGSELLIAPILEAKANRRSLYLPKGSWRDLHTGLMYPGNQWIEVDAPIEIIPVFMKGTQAPWL